MSQAGSPLPVFPRLDGQYGTGAVLTDVAGFAFVTRGKEYTTLDHPLVQARLHLPPDQFQQRHAQGGQPDHHCQSYTRPSSHSSCVEMGCGVRP